MPRAMPTALPISSACRQPPSCNVVYASSSSNRCCGSMACTSVFDTRKKTASKLSAPETNPPHFTHADCASFKLPGGTQRCDGTTPTASADAMATLHAVASE
eukprot:5226388-Prymnesium_polylepis.1